MRKKRLAVTGLTLCVGFLFVGGFLTGYPPCGGYPDWQTSPYVLPYPVGKSYPVYQANCTLGGHHGVYRYSYDFLMPIGTVVTAARAGAVVEILNGFTDGDPIENWVKIRHTDGTIAAYSHLHSISVKIGDFVNAGDPIGLSGNTGKTGGVPHLHFQVSTCSEPVNCGTLPVTFNNTTANSTGLEGNIRYVAFPFLP